MRSKITKNKLHSTISDQRSQPPPSRHLDPKDSQVLLRLRCSVCSVSTLSHLPSSPTIYAFRSWQHRARLGSHIKCATFPWRARRLRGSGWGVTRRSQKKDLCVRKLSDDQIQAVRERLASWCKCLRFSASAIVCVGVTVVFECVVRVLCLRSCCVCVLALFSSCMFLFYSLFLDFWNRFGSVRHTEPVAGHSTKNAWVSCDWCVRASDFTGGGWEACESADDEQVWKKRMARLRDNRKRQCQWRSLDVCVIHIFNQYSHFLLNEIKQNWKSIIRSDYDKKIKVWRRNSNNMTDTMEDQKDQRRQSFWRGRTAKWFHSLWRTPTRCSSATQSEKSRNTDSSTCGSTGWRTPQNPAAHGPRVIASARATYEAAGQGAAQPLLLGRTARAPAERLADASFGQEVAAWQVRQVEAPPFPKYLSAAFGVRVPRWAAEPKIWTTTTKQMTEEKRVQLFLPADDNDPWEIARVTPSVRWEQCVAQRDEGQSASVHAISTKAPGRPSSPSTGPRRNPAARRTGPCRCAPWPGPWAPAPSGGPAVATPQGRNEEVAQSHTNWILSYGGRRCATHSTTTWGGPRSCTWRPRAIRRCSSLGRKWRQHHRCWANDARNDRPCVRPTRWGSTTTAWTMTTTCLSHTAKEITAHTTMMNKTLTTAPSLRLLDDRSSRLGDNTAGPQQLIDQAHVEDLLLVEQELPRWGLEEPTKNMFNTENHKTTSGVPQATPTAVFPLTARSNRVPVPVLEDAHSSAVAVSTRELLHNIDVLHVSYTRTGGDKLEHNIGGICEAAGKTVGCTRGWQPGDQTVTSGPGRRRTPRGARKTPVRTTDIRSPHHLFANEVKQNHK